MIVSGVKIGPNHPCRLVAEIGNSHNGDLKRALRLITAAKKCGADFVKFQCYTPDELVELRGDGPAPDPWGKDGWTMRDLYTKAQTPHQWFGTYKRIPEVVADLTVDPPIPGSPARTEFVPGPLIRHANKVGIPWFSSVFGAKSLTLLESLDCPVYKIASLDAGDRGLRRALALTDKPIIASVAPKAGARLNPRLPGADLLLYCPPGYPQTVFDFQVLGRAVMAGKGGYRGLSFHGTKTTIPYVAIVNGAQIVEFHFHLADEPSELEANVCLNESDLKELAECVQHANAS